MSARFLDDAARAQLAEAIAAIERGSAAEVVVAVRRRSAVYGEIHAAFAVVAAFAALAVMLFTDHVFALTSILVDPFIAAALAAGAIELVPAVVRAGTTSGRKRRAVLRAARATFVERGVHNTRERTGVLVYLSLLERDAVVLGDSGVERKLSTEAHARIERALAAAIATGGAACARVLAELAPVLAAVLPRGDDDMNELPDALDSDLAARGEAPP